MTLYLVGLGPSPDMDDLTRRGQRVLERAAAVLVDDTTAADAEVRARALQALLGKAVELVGPLDVAERHALYRRATAQDVALGVAGDPLVATPFGVLCKEAMASGAAVEIVPGVSALSAAPSRAGLDAALLTAVVVADPARLTDREQARLDAAVARSAGVVMIAAGRAEGDGGHDWMDLAARLAQEHKLRVELIALGGQERSLVAAAVPGGVLTDP